MNNELTWIVIGLIVAPQGLKGEIRVNPRSDFPERFTKAGPRWIQKDSERPRPIQLLNGRQMPGKSIYVISFEGVNDRSSAESLVGLNLLVPLSDRPKLASDEFHLLDLLDLDVRLSMPGPSIGKVKNLTSAGNDLLEVQLLNGKSVLIPFVKEIVPEVNIKKGWLIITPPPGLLEL